MNNIATPSETYTIQRSHVHAGPSQQVEMMLVALCCGMTLLMAAVAVVAAISQIA